MGSLFIVMIAAEFVYSICSCLKNVPSHTSLHDYGRSAVSLSQEYFVERSKY